MSETWNSKLNNNLNPKPNETLNQRPAWAARQWILIALVAVSAAGCKQGIGDRCQVNADCASGVCSSSSPKVCVSEDMSQDPIDAMP